MTWYLEASNGERQALKSNRVRIGRHPDNDLVLDDPGVSRHHAELTLRDGAWQLTDLGSANGCWVDDRPVTSARLAAGDRLRLGPRCSFRLQGPSQTSGVVVFSGPFGEKTLGPGSYLLGREASVDLQVHDPRVSRRHARIDVTAEGATLTDLASTGGTYVNGRKVQSCRLTGGEMIEIGGERLQVRLLVQSAAAPATRIGPAPSLPPPRPARPAPSPARPPAAPVPRMDDDASSGYGWVWGVLAVLLVAVVGVWLYTSPPGGSWQDAARQGGGGGGVASDPAAEARKRQEELARAQATVAQVANDNALLGRIDSLGSMAVELDQYLSPAAKHLRSADGLLGQVEDNFLGRQALSMAGAGALPETVRDLSGLVGRLSSDTDELARSSHALLQSMHAYRSGDERYLPQMGARARETASKAGALCELMSECSSGLANGLSGMDLLAGALDRPMPRVAETLRSSMEPVKGLLVQLRQTVSTLRSDQNSLEQLASACEVVAAQ